ncbi:phosphoribosyl-AMP cyclohydrolase [candidate division MSBL1 archaeon SCGC-AAA261C02]|uniref:Phosphoribosyl-AMP cyclohydrolase n=1 Tax=candidate division MSBL1 archaeon SCGC-AAA261C02 TaxID=1698272 RepID=A0A133UZ91_9EURY|nr:phosphoribosyl-AMP cyclohydrolase [candidate division MSBL1 archaeon SCGC-AAA261C02]
MKLEKDQAQKIVDKLNFKDGLVSAMTRDYEDKEVLMTAFMNKEAVLKTLTTGLAHYWSRSRNNLWLKGEKSGHKQEIQEIRVDCDEDALLLDVKQEGGACHKGYRSCFYRKIEDGKLTKILEREFEPEDIYD